MTDCPPPRRPTRGFTPEAIAHTKHRYEDTDEPQDSIAADLGVHAKTLDRLAKREGWKLRKDRALRDLPEALKLEIAATEALAGTATDPPPDQASTDQQERAPLAHSLAFRLEQAVEKELRKVEALRSQFGSRAHRSIEAERTARTLATLTETLFKVRRLREGGALMPDAQDELPADANQFRHQLARRIDAFVRGRDDGGISAPIEPADAAPPQP